MSERRAVAQTSVDLPPELADRLRRFAQRNGETLAEVILEAYLHQGRSLSDRYETDHNRARKSLGLPPDSPSDRYSPNDPTVKVGLTINYAANEHLTKAASDMRMTRKRYITELLYLHLRDGGPDPDPGS